MGNVVKTELNYSEKAISYEILKDGYKVYLGDIPWIYQYEPYIPYPELGYIGSCLKQIEELATSQTEGE